MTTTSGSELAEFLETHLTPINDLDDALATSSAEINYEDFEEFKNSPGSSIFDQDFTTILKELRKRTEKLLISGEKCDVRPIFEESNTVMMKFNLFIWHFLENGKNSESTEEDVEKAALAGSSYIALCSMPGANIDLFQTGLYSKCLKVMSNCCQTIKIGETVSAKKVGGAKKKKKSGKGDETAAEEEEVAEPKLGPPRIAVDSAERFLQQLTTQLFGFLAANTFSIESSILMSTLEVIEDLGRLDLVRSTAKAFRANSVHEFRSLDRFTDRYCAFVHVLIESKYKTRSEMVYGRLIRPRLAMLPYPDESNKTSKITTERKKSGELTVQIILSRIERGPEANELKMIETVLGMIYYQCPELAEFRNNISVFIEKILKALPYQYAYDFVQLMHALFKSKGTGVKSLSTELATLLIFGFDFSAPDPGPVQSEETEDTEEEEEDEEDPDEDSDEEERNESRRLRDRERRENERKKRKESASRVVPRNEALPILYNIIYMACIDKSASLRLHGSNSFAKILESEKHRTAFQECCQKKNIQMDEKLGEIGDQLNESTEEGQNASEEASRAKKTKTDLAQDEQQIIQKFNKLKLMNKGEARVESDIIYMLVRRLAVDEKAPVKKSSCALLKLFLSFCNEQVKFEVIISILQKMCRDKVVSVRKMSAEAMTELMFHESVIYRDSLSAKWLDSLIMMLNDGDNDVTEHARKLIMRVLTPLLENTSDLTWTLLDTIESVTNHRQYMMTTLKDAVREKLVRRSVMDSMRAHISKGGNRLSGAWMVFSQLSVQYEANVDFAVDSFHAADLSVESNHVQYIMHIIENNVKKMEEKTKRDLVCSMKRTIRTFSFHSSHSKSLYHCYGKLIDGIGDRSCNSKEFTQFAEDLLSKCLDAIVQSLVAIKDKDAWKQSSESHERLLITALNLASEVVSFSPQLVPVYERLGKTLSIIINANENHADATAVNPDMPSAHVTRPPTQMSEVPSSQKSSMPCHENGDKFSDKVRAVAVLTLANMILAYDRLLKLMPMLVRQLQINNSHQIRSNIVVAIGDICASYKTDRYAPVLAASLCDPSVLVRRHAINQIARLITFGIFRFTGEIMIRMMLATLDANEDVRNDARLYISEVRQVEEADFFMKNFVQYMLALTQAKRLIGTSHDEEDRGQVDVAIGGGDPLARPSRIAIYTFMIESLNDKSRYEVKDSICKRIFFPIVNGEYDFADYNVQCLLEDALLIMASNEMQVKSEVGKNPNEDDLIEPPAEKMNAAADFMQKVYLNNYMETIVPALLALREFLNQHHSKLLRQCIVAIRMLCYEHKNDMDVIFRDDKQLKLEMEFELQRVKQRTAEANRILDEYLEKVSEFRKQQRRLSREAVAAEPAAEPQEAVENDVQMTSPVRGQAEQQLLDENMRTPQKQQQVVPRTPHTAIRTTTESQATPQMRPISPKTLKKIRRSVGALIKKNEMRLNAPNLEDTQVDETRATVAGKESEKETEDKREKTIVEEEMREEEEVKQEKSVKEEEPDPQEQRKELEEAEEAEEPQEVQHAQENEEEPVETDRVEEEGPSDKARNRRRKTPTHDDNESVDSEGRVWKKPKIVDDPSEPDSPQNPIDTSMNVLVRRSRRADSVVDEQRKNKRKAPAEVEEVEEGNEENAAVGRGGRDSTHMFDEIKLGAGRQCSTPIRGLDSDAADVTFALNLSAITEREEVKSRKSHAQILQNIFEEDEED